MPRQGPAYQGLQTRVFKRSSQVEAGAIHAAFLQSLMRAPFHCVPFDSTVTDLVSQRHSWSNKKQVGALELDS